MDICCSSNYADPGRSPYYMLALTTATTIAAASFRPGGTGYIARRPVPAFHSTARYYGRHKQRSQRRFIGSIGARDLPMPAASNVAYLPLPTPNPAGANGVTPGSIPIRIFNSGNGLREAAAVRRPHTASTVTVSLRRGSMHAHGLNQRMTRTIPTPAAPRRQYRAITFRISFRLIPMTSTGLVLPVGRQLSACLMRLERRRTWQACMPIYVRVRAITTLPLGTGGGAALKNWHFVYPGQI